MKGFKKLLTGILASAMAVSMALGSGAAAMVHAETVKPQITVTNAIPGQTYTLYKVFEFEPVGTTGGVYKIMHDSAWLPFVQGNGAGASFVNLEPIPGTGSTNDAGDLTGADYYVTWHSINPTSTESRDAAINDADVQAFAKAALAYAQDTNNSITGTTLTAPTAENGATTSTVEFKELDYAYYLVGSSAGALVSLDTSNPTQTIIEKNVIPTSEKKVQEDSTGDWGDRNDADLGQVVHYQSTVLLKAGQKNVIFHDQMKDTLELITTGNDAIKVEVGANALSATGENAAITINTTDNLGDDTFQVIFNQGYLNTITNDTTVTISYSATLKNNAIVNVPESNAYGAGNDNKSRIEYGDNNYTEWDWTRTYTWELNVVKYTGDLNNNPKYLDGAKFKLYKSTKKTDGTYEKSSNALTFERDVTTDGINTYIYVDGGTVTEFITPESGKIKFIGLDADVYFLEETEAPKGYNKLSAPVRVDIVSATNAQVDSKPGVTEGQIIELPTIKKDNETSSDRNVNVLNNAGTLLPSTGGIGTTIFYVIGGLLIVAGVAYFLVRRKVNAE